MSQSYTKIVYFRVVVVAPLPICLLPDTQNRGLRMHRECRKRFPRHPLQRKPLVCDPGMHHGTCVTHVGIASPRGCGKRSRHPRRMRNPQFYVSGKRPMLTVMNRAASYARNMIMRNQHNWKRCKLIYSSNLQTCWSRYCSNTICFSALENRRWPCHCWCSLERSWYLLGSQVYLLNRMS